jgi:hypothetical protein
MPFGFHAPKILFNYLAFQKNYAFRSYPNFSSGRQKSLPRVVYSSLIFLILFLFIVELVLVLNITEALLVGR